MSGRWRCSSAFVLAIGCGACGHSKSGPKIEENAALGGEVAARVGSQAIPISVVEGVARAQNVAAREAVRRIVVDEIAAAAARSRGFDRQSPASWRLVSARGRFTSDRIFEEAKRRGPPTEDEIAILSEKHWAEVDRPPAVLVVHAIVVRPKDAALIDEARRVAEELRKAVVSAADPDEFEKNAKSVAHAPKLETRVERLPPFTDKGWVTEGGGRMDEVFAKAAFALTAPGATSAVVESSFGWHVIRFIDRLPEKRMAMETRRIAFTEEVYSARARDLFAARVKHLRESIPIEILPTAGQLMQTVSVSEPVLAGTP